MATPFSLAYFDGIFHPGSPAFKELLETLAQMCVEYAADYSQAVLARDEKAFAEIRHKNVTLIENLELTALKEVQAQAKALVAAQAGDGLLQENVRLFGQLIEEVRLGLLAKIAQDFPGA